MADFEYRPLLDPKFVGRESELQWLDDRHFRRRYYSFTPLLVTGVGGVGKTALLRQFLASRRISSTVLWLDLYSQPDPTAALDAFIDQLYEQRSRKSFIVVLDGAETFADEQLRVAIGRVFNFKAVRSLLIATRRPITLEREDTLALGPLTAGTAARLLSDHLPVKLPPESVDEMVRSVHGYPLAVLLLAQLLRTDGGTHIDEILSGRIYDLSQTIVVPSTELITSVGPRIITANEALVARLRQHPETIYDLPARKFEELLAELLADMGLEVELTQPTRDGGRDILAYLNTDLGRLLCLVEAKRYRRDRKVGVDLVRKLYGTLCDSQANSAMLVTTSCFTSGAQEFQQRHKYQLALREYADIVQWLQNHRPKAV